MDSFVIHCIIIWMFSVIFALEKKDEETYSKITKDWFLENGHVQSRFRFYHPHYYSPPIIIHKHFDLYDSQVHDDL